MASSARKTLLVNFSTIALEANESLIIGDLFFLVFRSDDMAVDFLRNSHNLELTTLAFGLNKPIARGFLYLFEDLGAHILSVYDGIQLLFVGLDKVSITSKVLKIDCISAGSCV